MSSGRKPLPRFVVLRHDAGERLVRTDQCHFDWMFETEGALRTWSTEPVSFDEEPISVDAQSLVDHRMMYLDFEGDIGGGRGTVTKVIGGEYQAIETSPSRFHFRIEWTDEHHQSMRRTLFVERREGAPVGSWRLRDCR